jgi:hypothetical protein
MVATYNDKKDSLQIEATLKAKVEPNEMFADGDLGNSGFDLINDLNNIEIILFLKKDLVTFGGTYSPGGDQGAAAVNTAPAASPVTTGTLPVNLTGTTVTTGNQNNNANTGASAGTDGTGSSNNPITPQKSPFDTVTENKSDSFVGSLNPSQCFAGVKVDTALEKFAKDAATNDKLKSAPQNNSGGTGGSAVNSQAGAATNGGQTSPVAGGGLPNIDVPSAANTVPPVAPPLKAAPPGDYSAPPLCDNIICMSLDFVMKPATASFNKVDNCIQCHVQYINDGLQKTISHSLIPAKASGNLGESGLCKNAAGTALGSVGMNVSINLVPVITPAKDDLVTLGNITDEWSSYSSKYGGWTYGEKERRRLEALKINKPVDTSPIPDTIERQLMIEINNSPDNSSQGDVLSKARTADDTAKIADAQEELVAEISKDAYGQVDTLKALDDEMKSMNKYFDGFQRSMRTLLEDVPGLASTKACVKLNDTKECT